MLNNKQNAKIIVRVRPLLTFEDQPAWLGTNNAIQCMDTKATRSKLNKSIHHTTQTDISNYSFNFEKIIHSPSTSQKIHKSEIRPMIERSIHQNINSTIVAYGQTCSGKTYTLLGVKQAPGFIPCIFRDLFSILPKKQHTFLSYTIKLSYIELYNEKINDLLFPQNKNLKIINNQWGSQVDNCTKIEVTNFEDCLQVLDIGEERRKYAAKENHQRSSRSHVILKIYVQKRDCNLGYQRSVINVIDLAGSERLSQTSVNVKETGHINKSLFQFSNVIAKLGENGDQYIPYRDSKLTRMLQSSLTNNSLITIVFCISPAVLNLQESISTLRLATKAKSIQYQLQQPTETTLSQQQIKQLYKKISQKDKKIKQLGEKIDEMVASHDKLVKENVMLRKQIQEERNQRRKFDYDDDEKDDGKCEDIFVNIVGMMDHENFVFWGCGEKEREFLADSWEGEEFGEVKEWFVGEINRLYEQYAKKVLESIGYNNDIVRIEQICFLSMCYQRNQLMQYRLQMLTNMKQSLKTTNNHNKYQYSQLIDKYIQTINKTNNKIEKKQRKQHYILDSPILEESTIVLRQGQEQGQGKGVESGRGLYCWGCRKDGRVFQSEKYDSSGVYALEDKVGTIINIGCGTNHTLVLNRDGDVYGWGKNDMEQLFPNVNKKKEKDNNINLPTQIHISNYKIVMVAAGWGHSLALTQFGQVYSWGYGENGQLGHNNNSNFSTPKIIQNLQTRVTKIYAGHSHSGFIDEYQNYYACGFNKDYRLMIAQSKQIAKPTKISLRGIKKAALGVNHTFLLTKNNKLFCGGIGTNGQLGLQLNPTITGYQILDSPPKNYNINEEPIQKICPIVQLQYFSGENQPIDVDCGQNFTAVVTKKHQLYSFGKSSYGRLGHQETGIAKILEGVDRVAVGYRHGFAWNTKSKEVYGWGFNMYNQLGLLKARDLKQPELIHSLSSKQILDIKTGFFHSIAISK